MALGKSSKSDPLKALYSQYEAAQAELAEWRDSHRRVFSKESELREAIEVVEGKIKEHVRKLFVGRPSGQYDAFKGRFVRIEAAAKWKREFAVEAMLEAAPYLREIPGLVEVVVNRKKLDALVEEGTLDAEALKPYITYTQDTTAVTFKLVAEEEQ